MKLQIKNLYSTALILLLISIIFGYAFFLNSQKIFGINYQFTISQIGTILNFNNQHTAKLVRADIDYQNNLVEYELCFKNDSWEQAEYITDIKSTTKSGKIQHLDYNIVCADADAYVIRAKLPKKWTVVVADIKLADDSDSLHTKFYCDRSSLYETDIPHNNTRDDFIRLNAARSIEKMQNEIEELKAQNNMLNQKVVEIELSSENLTSRLPYLAGAELEEAYLSLDSMSAEKDSAIVSIDNNNKSINEFEADIAELQDKLS